MIEIPDGDTDSDGDGNPDPKNGQIESPGYPYTLPPHLSCRWLIRAPEGMVSVLYSLFPLLIVQ